jgi:polyisoprenoid-binding protein YceI
MCALRRSPLLVAVGLLLLAGAARAADWTLEDGSAIGFTATQQGRPVDGHFDRFNAAIDFDPEDLARSRVEVVIDVASIATGHKDRDAALRSSSFFDADRWPEARFVSDRFVHQQGDRYQAQGELSIRDVTRDVVLPFTLAIGPHPDAAAALQAKADGELTIARLDYGVGQGDFASTQTVGDEVVIRIAISARRSR